MNRFTGKIKKKEKKSDRGMTDRNRELVPGSRSQVREIALTPELSAEGCYSELSGVCTRAELPSVKVKRV